jgi:hypothetical protein
LGWGLIFIVGGVPQAREYSSTISHNREIVHHSAFCHSRQVNKKNVTAPKPPVFGVLFSSIFAKIKVFKCEIFKLKDHEFPMTTKNIHSRFIPILLIMVSVLVLSLTILMSFQWVMPSAANNTLRYSSGISLNDLMSDSGK